MDAMARLLLALSLAGSFAACGGSGPKLTKLRCRATPCQDAEDPFLVKLAVDFSDPTGTLGAGVIELRVDGKTESAIALRDQFNLQGIAQGAKSGTLNIDQDVLLSTVQDGATFSVSVLATNGQKQDSNEPSLGFTLHLGTGAQ